MPCPRCQHENRPQAKFCEACGTPLTANPSGPPAPSYAEITSALSEALEQQTATAEILRVISSSPTDVQPVFAAVLTSAARLCDAFDATIFQVDGDGLRIVAHEGPIPSDSCRRVSSDGERPRDVRCSTGGQSTFPICRPRLTNTLRAVPSRGPTVPGQCSTFLCSAGPRPSGRSPSGGPRSGRSPTGKSNSSRPSPTRRCIAIENVRLFNETKEALEQQTATAEILRVIRARRPTSSRSWTPRRERGPAVRRDLRRLLVSIGELLQLVAAYGGTAGARADSPGVPESPSRRESVAGRAILDSADDPGRGRRS